MYKEIEEFIKSLDNIDRFPIKEYDYKNYICEISDITKMQNELNYDGLLNFWIDKTRHSYGKSFEAKHPIYNNIITKAVYNIKHDNVINCIFFIDKNNKYPWILAQLTNTCNVIITPNTAYHIQDGWDNNICQYCKNGIKKFTSIDTNKLLYKETAWGFTLFDCRPIHFYYFQYFTFMDIFKKQNIKFIANDASFFKPLNIEKQDVVGFMPNTIPFDYKFGGLLSDKANYFLEEIVNESIRTLGVLSNTH
uniref:hypothetical protein n=1 Tax=Campylobacter lanienae TaxID=75658 RepID=UPI0015D8CEEB